MANDATSANTWLMRLPNEVLRLCAKEVANLDHALHKDWDYYHTRYGMKRDKRQHFYPKGQLMIEGQYALALTCRKFNAIVTPILYTRVSIDVHVYGQDWAPQSELFIQSLQANPKLEHHIKHLRLGVAHKDTISHLCRLPNLHTLFFDFFYNNADALGCKVLPEERGVANFTTLELRRFRAKPETIQRFLERPRNLRSFTLDHMTSDGYCWEEMEPDPEYRWSHAKLTDVLMPQQDSLNILKLGWLGYTFDQNTFKASLFPELHTLSLCIVYEKPTLDACRNWIAPSLKTLILDLHGNDSQVGPTSFFRDEDARRLIDVARWAQTLKVENGLKLENIGIRACTDGDMAGDPEKERHCLCHEKNDIDGAQKADLFATLHKMKDSGFRVYWIGHSGDEHTPEMVESYCQCDKGA